MDPKNKTCKTCDNFRPQERECREHGAASVDITAGLQIAMHGMESESVALPLP